MEEENNKLDIIIRQTNYSLEVAREKLQENNGDHIKVIKEYFGITEKKAPKVASVNQEIYRQLRKKLDTNMSDYRARVEKGEAKSII
jgi:exopolyphosphatase/pppGpp-phosphohydrolase